MPFLVPAVTALASDVFVLWLASTSPVETVFAEDHWVYHVQYLGVPIAALRLLLLCLPLLVHSYSGTVLRHARFYQAFYGATAILLVIHIVALALMDPESMEAIFPQVSRQRQLLRILLQHMHELRRIWWMLILSSVSVGCHSIILWHVRSTAPSTYYWDNNGAKQPTVYFAVRAGSMNGDDIDDEQHGPLIHAMNDFVVDMQSKLLRTKSEWTAKLEDFGHKLSSNNASTHGKSKTLSLTTTVTPFGVLLQLFAYQDNVLDKLDAVFDADDGESMRFYVPQLLSFLLHGCFDNRLEDWILKKCRHNVYFAHRCYWFLRAWCLQVPVIQEMSRKNSNNSLVGALQPFLDEPAALENLSSNPITICRPKQQMQQPLSASSSAAQMAQSDDKFLPEERAMIERLMMRVKEYGEEPALRLAEGRRILQDEPVSSVTIERATNADNNSFYEQVDSPPRRIEATSFEGLSRRTMKDTALSSKSLTSTTNNNLTSDALPLPNTSYEHSSAAMAEAAETGKIPVDPITGNPSFRHFDALALRHDCDCSDGFQSSKSEYQHRMLVSETTESLSKNSSRNMETQHFDKTPQFLDALIFMAESLFAVPREERRERMRMHLRSIECEMLPSNSVYLPIGNCHHRVWRIVPEESICISTKERVPCIIVMEVVDFNPPQLEQDEDAQLWNTLLLGALPQLSGNSSETFGPVSSQSPTTLAATVSMPVVSSTSIHNAGSAKTGSLHDDKYPTNNTHHDTPLPESDIVAQWRFGHRDPLRRISLLNKMTTTVKVPFDKIKTHVRDQLIHLRERKGSSEESMSLTEQFFVDATAAAVDTQGGNIALLSDAERGTAISVASTTNGNHAINNVITSSDAGLERFHSRSNSATSMVSLGQWSSQTPTNRVHDTSSVGNMKSDNLKRDLNDLRIRLDVELGNHHNHHYSNPVPPQGSPLLYGSDQEEDLSDRGKQSGQRPPRVQKQCIEGKNPVLSSIGKEATLISGKSSRSAPVVFQESWVTKQARVREKSAFGDHPGWRLLPILIKGNDDLRQEQLASQLIQRMAAILAREKVPVWLCPYEIIALTDRGGIVEAIPDTISLDSLKRNDPNYSSLNDFFITYFGEEGTVELAGAKANFVESLAAYSIVCFLLQIKDRHNGNILLDKWGHLIHIDFGFFFLSSPGKNMGFESSPFKLTREFVEVLDGPDSHLFRTFRELCVKTFLSLRKRCMEITLLVEMLKNGNEELNCFRGRPADAIQQLRERFRLDLNDRACREYVQSLVDDSIENWRTDWYDRYQRYFVGVL